MLKEIPPLTPTNELNALVIDNQSLVHEMITQALWGVGLTNVKCAYNAYHAVRLCEETQFDFVFIAFNVSSDRDGFHLFEELKHHNFIGEKTTVIFLSAETSAELVNCIVEMQPDDFWVKPLDKSRIEGRIRHLINVRKKLHKLLYCLHQKEFAAAIYYAERQLQDNTVSEYHPRLRRIVGDCLMSLHQFETAQDYYTKLAQTIDHAWVHIGLAASLLKQDNLEEADVLIESLLERRDTRFLTYDLLAKYYVEKEQFDLAYEQIKQASKLAPRNIQRNKRVWDLARLNHDKSGQLAAVQNMAKYAKNSIHDSPDMSLNVIRSSIDLATTLGTAEAEKLIRKASSDLVELQQRRASDKELANQISVIQSRVYCLQDKKKLAEQIMQDNAMRRTKGVSIEDNLDKMKAYHELGMREECVHILDALRTQMEGDTFSGQVVNAYLEQEAIERQEINFTPKELKQMAAVNYKENRLLPAFNNLKQAFVLSPSDKQIALSLLKVLASMNEKSPINQDQEDVAKKAVSFLSSSKLVAVQQEKFDAYSLALGMQA